MPKVSIIIPIYNVEKYLRECLDSVVNQTLKDIEIICVNDGSPDNSQDIIDEYAQKDNRIISIQKENGGYASAINYGLDIAKGEFIGIVESDDYCALNMYEKLYDKISGTNADYVISNFYLIKNSKTKKLKKYICNEGLKFNNEGCFNLDNSPSVLTKVAYPWKNLYRKDFLTKNNIKMLQDGNGAYEDQPWNINILVKAKNILIEEDALYYYRCDAVASSTNKGNQSLIRYITRRNQAKELLKNNGKFNDIEIKEYFYLSSLNGLYSFYKKISPNFKEEYYVLMQDFLQQSCNEGISLKYFSSKQKKRYKKIINSTYEEFTASWVKRIIKRFKKIVTKNIDQIF